MATVSFRVPDDIKERMDDHDEVNWSAVLRQALEAELARVETRNLGHAVATSERLSRGIDPDEVADQDTAELVREYRDARYGGDAA